MLSDISYLHIRKLYFVWSSFFIFLLYPLRYLTLSSVETSFVFQKQGRAIAWERIDIIELSFFCAIVLSLGFLLPKLLNLKIKIYHLNLLRSLFYVQVFLVLFVSLFLGAKMGTEQTIIHKLIFFCVHSLVPFDMLFLGLLLFLRNRKEIVFICFIFIVLAILKGSKSSLFFLLMAWYSVHILKGGSILNKKYLIYGAVVILLFPILSTVGNFIRLSGEGVDLSSISKFLSFNFELVELAFVAVSRRISGIDILMLEPVLNNNVFSNQSILLYYFKGFVPAFIVDTVIGNQSVGIGRLFAIEFLGQSPLLANAYGVSLFGVIHYANNKFFVVFLYLFSVVIFFYITRVYKQKWIVAYTAIYFVHQVPILLMSGYPLKITIFYRYIFVLACLSAMNLLFRKYFSKNKAKLKGKYETSSY